MKKVSYILIAACLLVVTSTSNVQLWKCLISGDILIDPACESVQIKEDSCCSSKPVNSTNYSTEDNCCEKLDSTTNLNLTNTPSPSKEKSYLNLEPYIASLSSQNAFIKARVHYFHNLPPPVPRAVKVPSFISNCSFLC